MAPKESVISTQVGRGAEREFDGRAEEEREEEDVREAELCRGLLAWDGEGDRERVEDLRLLLDDVPGRAARDREMSTGTMRSATSRTSPTRSKKTRNHQPTRTTAANFVWFAAASTEARCSRIVTPTSPRPSARR